MAERSCRSRSTGAPPAAAATSRSSTPNEFILEVDEVADIRLWPIAADGKYADVEAMADGELDVAIMNGAVRNSENEHICKLLRQKSKIFVAYGSCAYMGGIPGLANLVPRDEIFERAYLDNPSIEPGNRTVPLAEASVNGYELEIPKFYDRVYKLDQIVDVDYYVPGCPPQPDQCKAAILALVAALTGQADPPPKGAVVGAFERALCDDCQREKTEKKVKRFYRPWEIMQDPDDVPDGAGHLLRRHGDALGLRRALPQQRHPVPRLLRPGAGRDRPGRQAGQRRRLDHRQQGPRRDRRRSSRPCPTSRASPTATASRPRRCKGATGNDAEDQHRPHHPARGPRQDRDLPRRRRGRGGHLLPDPRAARLRALRRRPADRGAAAHRHAHLRRLPGEPPHGQRQGGGRLLRRPGRAARPQAARHVLPRALHPQPHRPLLRPRRPRLRARPRRRPGDAQRARRRPQGRPRDRRRGDRGARHGAGDPAHHRRAQHAGHLVPAGRRRQGAQEGGARTDQALGRRRCSTSRSSRCSCSTTSCSPTRPTSTSSSTAPTRSTCTTWAWSTRTTRPTSTTAEVRVVDFEGKEICSTRPTSTPTTSPSTSRSGRTSSSPTSSSAAGRASTRASGTSLYCATPLARLNVADRMATPQAQEAFEEMFATLGGHPSRALLANHWARLVEMVQNAETLKSLLRRPGDHRRPVPRDPRRHHRRRRRHRRGDARHAHPPLHLRRARHLHQRQPHRRHDQQQRRHPHGDEEGRAGADPARARTPTRASST